jgi:transcriptional regulator with XRE-family HTH domain
VTKRKYRQAPALRRWMDARGLSQAELADMLSLSQAQVSRYLSGDRALSLAVILQLANLTGLPAERLSNNPRTTRILKLLGVRTNSHSVSLNDPAKVV